jgi:ribosomal protein S18 acetylase RimI-like enzyme
MAGTTAELIEIRKATLDDIPAMARVHVQADWDTYSALFGSRAWALELGESECRLRRVLCDGDILLVASDGDPIIGLGHAGGNRISALNLLHSHQRRGIGRALLASLLAALNKRGVAEARFDVAAINVNAIRFYRAVGAYPIGRCINRDPRGDTEDLVFAIPTATAG